MPAMVRKVPGEPGIWVMITGDLVLFSLLFGLFLFNRAQHPEVFLESQSKLDLTLGLVNTLLMLTSSWCVALAVRAEHKGLRHLSSPLLFGGAACGLSFIVVKYFEYGAKLKAGITLTTNEFFMYYFVYTGIHLIHVVIGIGVLVTLGLYARAPIATPTRTRNIESGASFWHLVDLLWIVLFALLYLVR